MQDGNAPDVKTNLILRHKFNRSYKDINVGDEAIVFLKETNIYWNEGTCEELD